jgi:hypothetical protein
MTRSEWNSRLGQMIKDYDPFRNLEHFETLITEPYLIETWDQFEQWTRQFGSTALFRGQRESDWHLTTTLDRETWKKFEIHTDDISSESLHPINKVENERLALGAFKREAIKHFRVLPADENLIDWLALMQHFGAPTRMMDWTHSAPVAMHFAMEHDDYKGNSALFAIDGSWLQLKSRQLIEQHHSDCPSAWDADSEYEYVARSVDENLATHPVVIDAIPRQMNERIEIQGGHTLCNLRHDTPFSVAMLGMFLHPAIDRQVMSKAVVSRKFRDVIVGRLHANHINHASLFPGTDEPGTQVRNLFRSAVEQQVEDYIEETITEIRKRREQTKRDRLVRA